MNRRLLSLAVCLVALVGCDDEPAAPGAPISAPLAGDIEPRPDDDCVEPTPIDTWSYAWDGDRLTSARLTDAAGTPLDDQRFEWGEAGLLGWRREAGEVVEYTLQRDAAGSITGWTRTQDGRGLEVAVAREGAEVVVTARGLLYLDLFEGKPRMIPVEDLAPGWAEAAPRIDLVLGYVLARWGDDEARLVQALEEAQIEQRASHDAGGRLVRVGVDLDGEPGDEVEELRRYTDAGVEIVVDYDLDGRFERVVRERTEGAVVISEVDEDGDGALDVVVRTEETAAHLFEDRDEDADGVVDHRTSVFFDGRGARLIKYEDEGADGRPEWRKRYVNDSMTGLRRFDERDGDVDGRIDDRREYLRDDAGHITEIRHLEPQSGECHLRW